METFYWAEKLDKNNFLLLAADSTGHGVPGAIMSILNITCIEQAVNEGLKDPGEILDHSRTNIIERLKKDGSAEGGKDGMDCSLLNFDFENNKLKFALAHNSLWLWRKGELQEFKADKMPVGKHDRQDTPFTSHEIEIQKGDSFYIFSDGYADQFGGEKGKKFKAANMKRLIGSIQDKGMKEQEAALSKAFEDWKGNLEQIDDVVVIGVRV